MKNLAGTGDDQQAKKELEEAGIEIFLQPVSFAHNNECKLRTVGTLGPWVFTRSWYYWVAEGPGINIEQAVEFNDRCGKNVRACGVSGGIEDLYERNNGFAISIYHIDTQDGLNDFARLLRSIMADAKTKQKT